MEVISGGTQLLVADPPRRVCLWRGTPRHSKIHIDIYTRFRYLNNDISKVSLFNSFCKFIIFNSSFLHNLRLIIFFLTNHSCKLFFTRYHEQYVHQTSHTRLIPDTLSCVYGRPSKFTFIFFIRKVGPSD